MEEQLNAPSARSLAVLTTNLESWRPTPLVLARTWAIAVLVMVAPYLPALTLMHEVFLDEIHIAEYGRLFLEPHTSWSIFWLGDHGLTPWYYVGSTFAELASRTTSPSCLGQRLFTVLGAVLASGTLVAWLWRRRTLPAAALLLGLLFLFSPGFMLAYTAGRIDGWMLACAFAAGYQIAAYETSARAWHLFAAGCLISLGFFIWPSITFLLPLLGLELWRANRLSSRPLWQSLAIVGSGAALVFLGLSGAVMLRVPSVLDDMTKQLVVAGMAPGASGSGFAKNFGTDIRTLLSLLVVRSPWNVAFAILVWRNGAPRAPLVWMLLPIAVMLATLLYGNRLIYLLPYMIVAFSGIFAAAHARDDRARQRKPGPATWWLLVGSVATVFVFAAVVRPVLPWLHRATRSETLLYSAAETAAARSSNVCLDRSAIEFYLIGRRLDWHMFMLEPHTIARCETVIVRPEESAQIALLDAAGFRRDETLLANQREDAPVWEQHVYGSNVYGPYDVYRKPRSAR